MIFGSILLLFDAQVLPSHAPVISFTYSAHSFQSFGFVVSESRVGIIVPSGADKSDSPVAPFQFPVALLTIASA